MPAVPDNVLNWLHGVLRNEYRDVNRTYSDTAKTLASYQTLRPKTEVKCSAEQKKTVEVPFLGAGLGPAGIQGLAQRLPAGLRSA